MLLLSRKRLQDANRLDPPSIADVITEAGRVRVARHKAELHNQSVPILWYESWPALSLKSC